MNGVIRALARAPVSNDAANDLARARSGRAPTRARERASPTTTTKDGIDADVTMMMRHSNAAAATAASTSYDHALVDADACVAWMLTHPHAFDERIVANAYAQKLSLRAVETCTDDDWTRLGATTLGRRVRIRRAIRALRRASAEDDARECGTKRVALAPVFTPRQACEMAPKMKRAKPNASMSTPKTTPAPKTPPPWIRPPGSRFIVDGFHHDVPSCAHWFLTHFHADHYRGLTKTFANGCVYASPSTSALIRARLGVDAARVRSLDPWPATHVIDGVKVTLIDANHCPGAVMILFEFHPAQKKTPVLHTGDFRFHPSMRQHPALADASRLGVMLILDTTYCAIEHVGMPSQEHVLKCVRDAVVTESVSGRRVLFLFGAYSVGKEKVFFDAARALGTKAYVGKTKRQILACLNLSKDERALLTSDDTKTNVHVVDMGSTSFKKMAAILKYYKSRYDSVVAFKPTGWTFSAEKKATRATSRRARGALIQYAVPYSEHSSCDELREFVKFIQPSRVFPHVGNDRGENAARMMAIIRASDDEFRRMRDSNKENA